MYLIFLFPLTLSKEAMFPIQYRFIRAKKAWFYATFVLMNFSLAFESMEVLAFVSCYFANLWHIYLSCMWNAL